MAAILACWCMLGASRALGQSFRFDNGFEASATGLAFEFSRATGSVDAWGRVLGPDEPRYARTARLLCGAPQVRLDQPIGGVFGGALMAAASGVASDDMTPLLVLYAADPARLQIRQENADGSFIVLHDKAIGYPDGPRNILKGELFDRNGEGIRYEPVESYVMCHGLLMAICQVNVLENGQWVSQRSAVCYWDMAAPQLGWRFVDIGPQANTQPGKKRGSAFQHSGYHVLSPGPVTEVWLPFSDYVLNNQSAGAGLPPMYSDSGIFYLIRATRPVVGEAWTVGPLAPVYKMPNRVVTPGTAVFGQHAHPPYIERFGTAGLRMVCPVGDSWPRNRVAVAVKGDDNYAQGSWTIIENTHGSAGVETDAVVGLGNQFVGSAPLGTPSAPLGHAIGADEMGVSIARCVLPQRVNERINFTRLYGQPTASFNHAATPSRPYGWNTFHITAASPETGGPFAALVLPSNQPGWFFDTSVTRLLFSRDGMTWGQAWATDDVQPWPPRFVGDRIFVGSADRFTRLGLRSIPIPETRTSRPLLVGSGGVNLLAGGGAISEGSVDAGNTVTALTRTRTEELGIPLPPTATTIYKCVMGSGPSPAGRRVGTWMLTRGEAIQPDMPESSTKIKVRAWLYPLPWDRQSQPFANSLAALVSIGCFDPLYPSNPVGGSREEFSIGSFQTVGDPVGGWIPMTFDTDTRLWTAEPGRINPSTRTKPFGLGLRIRGDGNTPRNPCEFLIAFESVQAGDGVTWGVTPAAEGPFSSEHADISGFTCDHDWTIRLAGEVPDDAWDQTVGSDQNQLPLTLCTLVQDQETHLQVRANLVERSIDIVETHAGQSAAYRMRPNATAGVHQRFSFLRGSPVLLAMTHHGDKITVHCSVGGTSVVTSVLPGGSLRPTRIRLGDPEGNHPAAMLWWGGRIDGQGGVPEAEAGASLATLQFLPGN